MSDHVGSATQVQAVPQPQDIKATAPESRPRPVPQDTVQLSGAAQSALREATETPAQTAKEAGSGDMQAKRLLAKQEAAKESAQAGGKHTHVVA